MAGGEANIEWLYSQYRAAVSKGSIEDILRIGELYFSALRDGAITEADREQLQQEAMHCAVARNNS